MQCLCATHATCLAARGDLPHSRGAATATAASTASAASWSNSAAYLAQPRVMLAEQGARVGGPSKSWVGLLAHEAGSLDPADALLERVRIGLGVGLALPALSSPLLSSRLLSSPLLSSRLVSSPLFWPPHACGEMSDGMRLSHALSAKGTALKGMMPCHLLIHSPTVMDQEPCPPPATAQP